MDYCATIRGAVLSALLILLVLIPPAALAQSKGVAVQARQAPPAAEQRIALVIGNGNYKVGPLRNPVRDARAMAAKLEALGFEVIALEDATQRDMKRAMFDFGRINRGGSWNYARDTLRCSHRDKLAPHHRFFFPGFRLLWSR